MNSFDLNKCVAKGTRWHSIIGWAVLVLAGPLLFVVTVLASYGIALLFWIAAALTYGLRMKRAYAQLRGGALAVSPEQFPHIYETAVNICHKLGLRELPEIFILEDNTQNALALRLASRNFIVLVDDMVHGAECTGNEKALSFIIAHELAHHALGHTGFLRRLVAQIYKPLSRLDEFSCDAVAHQIIGDETAARDALALLLVGPHLFARVNRAALDRQAEVVMKDKYSRQAERNLSHPLLLRRYARLLQPAF